MALMSLGQPDNVIYITGRALGAINCLLGGGGGRWRRGQAVKPVVDHLTFGPSMHTVCALLLEKEPIRCTFLPIRRCTGYTLSATTRGEEEEEMVGGVRMKYGVRKAKPQRHSWCCVLYSVL